MSSNYSDLEDLGPKQPKAPATEEYEDLGPKSATAPRETALPGDVLSRRGQMDWYDMFTKPVLESAAPVEDWMDSQQRRGPVASRAQQHLAGTMGAEKEPQFQPTPPIGQLLKQHFTEAIEPGRKFVTGEDVNQPQGFEGERQLNALMSVPGAIFSPAAAVTEAGVSKLTGNPDIGRAAAPLGGLAAQFALPAIASRFLPKRGIVPPAEASPLRGEANRTYAEPIGPRPLYEDAIHYPEPAGPPRPERPQLIGRAIAPPPPGEFTSGEAGMYPEPIGPKRVFPMGGEVPPGVGQYEAPIGPEPNRPLLTAGETPPRRGIRAPKLVEAPAPEAPPPAPVAAEPVGAEGVRIGAPAVQMIDGRVLAGGPTATNHGDVLLEHGIDPADTAYSGFIGKDSAFHRTREGEWGIGSAIDEALNPQLAKENLAKLATAERGKPVAPPPSRGIVAEQPEAVEPKGIVSGVPVGSEEIGIAPRNRRLKPGSKAWKADFYARDAEFNRKLAAGEFDQPETPAVEPPKRGIVTPQVEAMPGTAPLGKRGGIVSPQGEPVASDIQIGEHVRLSPERIRQVMSVQNVGNDPAFISADNRLYTPQAVYSISESGARTLDHRLTKEGFARVLDREGSSPEWAATNQAARDRIAAIQAEVTAEKEAAYQAEQAEHREGQRRYAATQERRAGLDTQFKQAKFTTQEIKIPLRADEGETPRVVTTRAPVYRGLAVVKESAFAPEPTAEEVAAGGKRVTLTGYNVTHVATGKRTVGGLDRLADAKMFAMRLSEAVPELQKADPMAGITPERGKEIGRIAKALKNDPYADLTPPEAFAPKPKRGKGIVPPPEAQRGAGRGREYAEEAAPKGIGERGAAQADDVKELLSTGKEQGRAIRGVFRFREAERALKAERGRQSLLDMQKSFDRMPDRKNAVNSFVDQMEAGETQPSPELQGHADALREILDEGRRQVQDVGKLQDYIENYFPHIYKDPKKAGKFIATWLARRPLEGSKSFLKKRTFPTRAEALEAGLEPLFDNPVDDVLAKRAEMDRYVMARKVLKDGVELGAIRRVFSGYQRPAGMKTLPDPIGTILTSGKMKIQEAVDTVVYDKLSKLADELGIRVRRPVVSGGRFGEAQVSPSGIAQIKATFATPVGTLTHEIGHVLDSRYGLWDRLTKGIAKQPERSAVGKELRALADLRLETAEGLQPNEGGSFGKYVRKRTEKMANMVDAYVNHRERMADVAPKTLGVLEQIISENPELSSLKDTRPSLARKAGTATVQPEGPVIAGQYVAAPEVARIFENFLSPGLRGRSKAYDLYRTGGNFLNQAQLSMSAFHAGMTGLDSNISTVALGLKQLATPGQRLQGIGRLGLGMNPLEFGRQIYRGGKLIKEAINGPLDSEIAQLLTRGGGRTSMDTFYYNRAADQFARAFRRGEYVKGALRAPGALIETISKPIMQGMVPRLKMAAFYDMAKYEVARLGPEATEVQLRDALGKAWDSVDNRLGQLVYDNLFWNRVVKDLSMASVRSVGWNLGTIREFGGAARDLLTTPGRIAGKEAFGESAFTHRMAYAVAMPIMAGIYGAVYQYLHTGKSPEQLLDYYFPQTGDGAERASLPTYMKDLYSYGRDVADVRPLRTVSGKIHPFLTSIYEMLNNRDWFNKPIRNEHHPLVQQMKELANFWLQQYEPIPFRQMPKEKTTGRKVENFFGIVRAPKRIIQKGAVR